ncbi:MAG: sigma-70 family RNA polymerase sigma factor [Bacteroidetes bacterium]|nr:sigma-70 family RNA polymerase sigma factor [Bacteroidota bacterium]
MHLTEDALIEGIKQHDNQVLRYIYKKYFDTIKNLIKKNNGNDEDAQDIFQEAIIIIYKKIKEENLELSCSLSTYLYSVCRLLWLKQLEKKKIRGESFGNGDEIEEISSLLGSNFELNDEYKLYQYHFNKLNKDCQKVLRLFLEKVPLREIAEIMGYKTEQYAKKRKFECKNKLVDSIKNDLSLKNNDQITLTKH